MSISISTETSVNYYAYGNIDCLDFLLFVR